MTRFSDQSFANRFKVLGDPAEQVFTATYPEGSVKFGLDRPPINLKNVPPFLRFTPDMLTGKSLVEVQGLGRDQTAKFKVVKLAALDQWHDIWRVDWFIWDSHKKRYAWVRHGELGVALDEHGWDDAFDDGATPFRAIKADDLPVVGGVWTAFDPTDEMAA